MRAGGRRAASLNDAMTSLAGPHPPHPPLAVCGGRGRSDLDQRPVVLDRLSGPKSGRAGQPEPMRNLVDLASRRGGGIEVALIWDRRKQTLVVFAHDDLTNEEVAISVSGAEATEVYRHPFAYAYRSLSAAHLPHGAAPALSAGFGAGKAC